MKLRNVLLALVLVATPSVVQAQTPTTAQASLVTSGTIKSSVTAGIVSADIPFGTAGVLAVGANTGTGVFSIQSNQTVSLGVAFSDLTGPATITVTGACKIGPSSTDASTATAFASGCAAQNVTFTGLETKYVHATGTATVDATLHPPGIYSGTAVMSATYNQY